MKQKILNISGLVLGLMASIYISWIIGLTFGLVPLYEKHEKYISTSSNAKMISGLEQIGTVFDPRCFGMATVYIDSRNKTHRACE